MRLIQYILTISLALWQSSLFAQTPQPKPQGKFLAPTMKVGETIRYSLSVRYPSEMEIFFPDSTFDYKPFEFVSKNYFPTVSKDGQSFDSVIYELQSFELDSLQSLALPIFAFQGKDTVEHWSKTSEISLKPLIINLPDSAKVIENTEYMAVDSAFNYPYWIGGTAAVGVLGTIIFFLFGDRIRKAYRLRRMRNQYVRFTNDFEKTLNKTQDLLTTEQGLTLWKAYLENLQDIPFTTYTSKEIADIFPDEILNTALKNIDRAIYGNRINEQTTEALRVLKNYAQNAYENKIKEVLNA